MDENMCGGIQNPTQTLRSSMCVTPWQGCRLPRLQAMVTDEKIDMQDGVLISQQLIGLAR